MNEAKVWPMRGIPLPRHLRARGNSAKLIYNV